MPDLATIPTTTPRIQHRFLSPGDLLVVTAPSEITTILGPCIAATFWCAHSHVGAICHAMLPSENMGFDSSAGDHPWKYVSTVIPEMWRRFLRKGGTAGKLEVKLFGGADLLRNAKHPSSTQIGPHNIELAQQLLAECGLRIIASDVGGQKGRKLIFNTQTGDVRIKRLPHFTSSHA
ncbi:MAG TPA: chemotaxis protein CheD [Lacunisphaera sp.]